MKQDTEKKKKWEKRRIEVEKMKKRNTKTRRIMKEEKEKETSQ